MFVDKHPSEARLVRANIAVAFFALLIGGTFGLIQALHRTAYFREIINSVDYYTVLTGHGVLLALVFTFFFTTGLFTWAVVRSLDRSLRSLWFSWFWFLMMGIGTAMSTVAILGGLIDGIPTQASVLYTFYAPLKAHPLFYFGAALLIVGTWLAGLDWILLYRSWRSDHPEARIPLQTHMVLFTMLMWYISSIGVAIEVIVFLIPWSMGWIQQVDPLLTRTLFWYFGHPVVYFWLLPAYLVWYTIFPKLAGGRLFSDPLARVVFVLFLILSTPVGFHHQFVDPGISPAFKFVAMTNTMFLLLPSLLTAFTVLASIEYGARQNGGEGLISWLTDLPWGDPAFAGIFLAALMFAAGGFSGMVNAGMNLNYLVHNTLWVPGHFHLTVGTAVALTFMSISYWLLPQLTGKPLRFYPLAILHPYLWFLGMTLMSNAMHRAGLAGTPRRSAEPTYRNVQFDQLVGGTAEMKFQIALGGGILFVSLLCFLFVIGGSWLLPSRDCEPEVDSNLPEPISGSEASPLLLDRFGFWLAIAIILILAVYALPIWSLLSDGIFSPGVKPFVP